MTKHIAKVLIENDDNQWLVLLRGDHPRFPNDPDLPGGTVEVEETPSQAAVREVEEEAGIVLLEDKLQLLYEGSQYSENGTQYHLYVSKMHIHQEPSISWEHESYEWVSKDTLLKMAEKAKDTYMHMVSEVIRKHVK